jgi:hypothetical protein
VRGEILQAVAVLAAPEGISSIWDRINGLVLDLLEMQYRMIVKTLLTGA